MEKEKRKSRQKRKINVELKKIGEKLNVLVFTLENPFHQVAVGSTGSYGFEEVEEMSAKINSIFRNVTNEYTYCLEEDIKTALGKV